MTKPKTITLDPEEIAIIEEAIDVKKSRNDNEIHWKKVDKNEKDREKLIEENHKIEKVKRKLK